jgi:glycosyltransferase involved in cell wall biosynthesis
MGRVIGDKGVSIAIDMTKRMGVKLLVVGQGDMKFVTNGVHDHVTHIHAVGPKERCEIMRNAKALIAPTYYAEPFGMVVVEAMMCGTPVLTSDWGAFAETNLHGITGYRCRNVEQFVWAGRNIHNIRRQACRDWAVNNYSLERVAPMYQEYFEGLEKVFNGAGGFFCENDTRKDLNWLTRKYPTSS